MEHFNFHYIEFSFWRLQKASGHASILKMIQLKCRVENNTFCDTIVNKLIINKIAVLTGMPAKEWESMLIF